MKMFEFFPISFFVVIVVIVISFACNSVHLYIASFFGFILANTIYDMFTNKNGGSTGDWWG